MFTSSIKKTVAIGGAGVVLAMTLGACGSDSTDASAATQPSAGQGRPSFNVDFEAIQACLDAAGIKIDVPTGGQGGFPSGAPTDMPSLEPGQSPPSLEPGQSPPAGFGGGNGSGLFSNKKVQRALKACGITLPTRPAAP